MDRHRRALSALRTGRAATVVVPLAFLALFFAWPLVTILRRSLVVDGSLDLPFDVLTASSTREIAWFTLCREPPAISASWLWLSSIVIIGAWLSPASRTRVLATRPGRSRKT